MTKRKTDFDIDWDVDKYRCEFEPENHWNLRRKFMVAHKETYPEDRLVSLAQLFINIECLGCRYPEKAMELIDQLSHEVAQDFREDQKGKLQRTCVGASSVAEARAKGSYSIRKPIPKMTPIQFVSADSTLSENKISMSLNKINTTEAVGVALDVISNSQNRNDLQKNEQKTSDLKGKSKKVEDLNKYTEALKILDGAVNESKISNQPAIQAVHQLHEIVHHLKVQHKFEFEKLESGEMQCNVYFLDKVIAFGKGSSKKLAKDLAVKNALIEIRKIIEDKLITSHPPEPKTFLNLPNVVNESSRNTMQRDFKTINNANNVKNVKSSLPRNSNTRNRNKIMAPHPLVFMFRTKNNFINYTSMVNEAVTLAKQSLSYEFEKSGDLIKGHVIINQERITSGVGETQKMAKENACQNAYKILQQSCYTVKVKHTFLSDKVIDQSNVSGNKKTENDSKKIDHENIGNKLLRMMGWQGGGLGKQEQGIEAPVGVNTQFKRSGLGHTNSMNDFKSKLDKLYQKFIQGEYGSNDLVFSNEFSKEQRETMHQLARKYGLKSHSHGTGEERHLVVSLKKSPWEIVEDLLQGRGEDKYELIPPMEIS